LWETTVDPEPAPDEAVVDCHEVTTTRQAPLPNLTAQHHARFAVLCARAAYAGGAREAQFNAWADGWLAGHDSSGVDARALADELEAEAHRGVSLTHPEELMAANAARAAAQASKLSWLAGRARDQENTRAIDLASEAVRTALRITRLDLLALAEQASPRPVSPVPPLRGSASPVTRNRILRALPT
jgi:hypothetical protein